MKVYIITKVSFPYGWAASNRIKCLAKAFMCGGAECKVLIFGRNFTSKANSEAKGIYEEVPFDYVGGSTRRVKGNLLGRLQAFYLQIYLLFILLFSLKSGDFICAYINKNNYFRRILLTVAHMKRAYFISELCELPFGTGEQNEASKKGRTYELNKLFPRYDGVIAISDALVTLAKQYSSPRCVVEKVPILVDYKKYDLVDRSSEAQYPYIFHSGTLYEQKDGILGMIEAFGLATKRLSIPLHFISTGHKENSPHCDDIEKLIEKYQIQDRIHFVGYLSNEELRDALSKASLVIINKYPTQQNVYCFSTKLGEYMAAGKPLIITRVGEAMNWVKENKDAVVVEPQNTEELTDAIVDLINNPQKRSGIGCNAKQTCQKAFDYSNYGIVLADMLQKISSNY